MAILERYLRYLGEIAEGKRPAPEGFPPKETEQLSMGQAILQLVEQCAGQDGEEISQEERDSYDPNQVEQMLQSVAEEPTPDAQQADDRPRIEEPDEPRNACEVLLDCCLLDDNLFIYLMETLKTGDGLGFFKLSQVATKQDIPPQEFLRWLGTKEHYADAAEQACVAIMDAVLSRLEAEGQMDLLAALLSGDQKTFELFRCEAPELVHLPDATYEWYETNYLNRYYPVRFMMRRYGVTFPKFQEDRV